MTNDEVIESLKKIKAFSEYSNALVVGNSGLTRREYVASQAMQAIISTANTSLRDADSETFKIVARVSVCFADALLKELSHGK